MTLLRALWRIAVLGVMPIVGYLIGATIVFHFSAQYGDEYPDGSSLDSKTYAVATSCERQGPVSAHGFGYWWCAKPMCTGRATATRLNPAQPTS